MMTASETTNSFIVGLHVLFIYQLYVVFSVIKLLICSISDTGSLSLEEFIRLVGNLGLKSGPEIEQEFEDALRFFDKDGRGLIEADQLKAALQSCGEPLEDDDIVEMMKLADVKGDGKIDYLGALPADYFCLYRF
jgi:Ca2+-binding EF-hand superfamily protein